MGTVGSGRIISSIGNGNCEWTSCLIPTNSERRRAGHEACTLADSHPTTRCSASAGKSAPCRASRTHGCACLPASTSSGASDEPGNRKPVEPIVERRRTETWKTQTNRGRGHMELSIPVIAVGQSIVSSRGKATVDRRSRSHNSVGRGWTKNNSVARRPSRRIDSSYLINYNRATTTKKTEDGKKEQSPVS